jgi:hypothetical protein
MITYWYCPDCGAKGYARGEPAEYETLRSIGISHRASHDDGGECLGMHIRTSDQEYGTP